MPKPSKKARRRFGLTFLVPELPRFDCDAALHGMGFKKRAHGSPITKPPLREMLQIIKSDERPTGVAFPSDFPWAEFLHRYAPSVLRLGLGCNWAVATTLMRNKSPDFAAGGAHQFQFQKLISAHYWLKNMQTGCFLYLVSCVVDLRSTFA